MFIKTFSSTAGDFPAQPRPQCQQQQQMENISNNDGATPEASHPHCIFELCASQIMQYFLLFMPPPEKVIHKQDKHQMIVWKYIYTIKK